MNAALVQVVPLLWLLVAVALEIAGTYLLKLSDGMSRRLHGAGGILLVMGAFAALAQAILVTLNHPPDRHVLQERAVDFRVDNVIGQYLKVMGLESRVMST